MKQLIKCGNAFIKTMKVQDMALLKICVFALGILVGLCICKKQKKKVMFVSSIVFAITYIPIMSKFLKYVTINK